jgi:hypothetical protein
MENLLERMPQEKDAVMSEPERTTTSSDKADPALQQPPSPPESPATASRQHKEFVKVQSRLADVVDPTVIPQGNDENDGAMPAAEALFPPIHDPIDAAIQKHMQEIAVHFVPSKSKGDKRTLRYQMPSLEEYRLAAAFVTTLHKQKPGQYLQRMRATDNNVAYVKRIAPRPALVPLQVKPSNKVAKAPQTPRVRKTTTTTPSTRKTATPRVKTSSQETPTPRSRVGTPHTRNREPKKPIDENWTVLPDFSPSSTQLDAHPRAFGEVNWDGNPLDISQDPNMAELHEAERRLASSLRLSCARYLTCKRRIFIARLEALKINKAFKKTDAQQACQIDVNKASKLWVAYDKMGWFQPHHFTQYLRDV